MADSRMSEGGHFISPAPGRVVPPHTQPGPKAPKTISIAPSATGGSPGPARPESPQRSTGWGKALPSDQSKADKRMSVGLYLNTMGSPQRATPPPAEPPAAARSPPPAVARIVKPGHLSTPLGGFQGFSVPQRPTSPAQADPAQKSSSASPPQSEVGRPRADRPLSPPVVRPTANTPLSPRGPVVPRLSPAPTIPSAVPFTGKYPPMLSPARDGIVSPMSSPREQHSPHGLPMPAILEAIKEIGNDADEKEDFEQPTNWQHRLIGKRVILSENAAAAPILRMLPPFDNREFLFLLETDEFRRLVDRGRQVSESARIFAKYLGNTASLALANLPDEMPLACIPAIAHPSTAPNAFDHIADYIRRRMISSPVIAYKNIAQTVVQGLLLNDDPYRMPDFIFPALVAELTRSDSITWSTLPESNDTIKIEERVLEGSAVPLLRATSIISASFSEQPLRLMLASIFASLSIRRQWDETCTDARMHTRLQDQQAEIIHLKHQRLTDNLKRRDYVVLQTRRMLPDKVFVSVMSSIEHPGIPRSTRYTRGYMPVFAVVLKPLEQGQVHVTIAHSIHMKGLVPVPASIELQVRTAQNQMNALRKTVPLWEARLRKRPASPKKTRYYTPFLAKALVAVVAEDQGLNLLDGDVMYILKLQDDGTCVAYLNGHQGLVRSEFLQFHADAEYPHTSESYAPLEALVLDTHWAVVRAIADSADATVKDQVAAALLKVYHKRDKLNDLVKTLISVHIATTVNVGTLFRGSEMVSILLAKLARFVGQDYLVSCVSPLVDMILRHSTGRRLELTPETLDADPQQLKLVTQLVDAFLNKLYGTLHKLPTLIRVFADQLKRETNARFPGSHLQIVGGFLFLRFICPAVVSPDSHGCAKPESVTTEGRRALVQIGKIIQNISNGHEFNEPHMRLLNEFAVQKKADFDAFLETVATVPEVALPDRPLEKCTDQEDDQAFGLLHTSLSQRLPLVRQELQPWGGALPEGDMFERVLAVLLDLGPPGPRHKRLTEAEAITAQVMKKLDNFNALRADAHGQLMQLISTSVRDSLAQAQMTDLLQQLEAFDVQRGMFRNLLHSIERETRLKDASAPDK